MRKPVQPISKRYGILRQIKEREVWAAWVGYEDQPSKGKYRPVLVIDVNDTQAVVMSIPFTSTTPRDEYDIEVFDWHDIPLDHISTARISKTIVIPISDFRKRLGRVSDEDWNNITDLLMTYMEHHAIGK